MNEPAELRDTRLPPRALVPLKLPVWVMVALAAALMLLIAVNMVRPQARPAPAPTPAAPARAAALPPPLPPVQRFDERTLPEALRQQAPPPQPPPVAPGAPYGAGSYEPPDRIAEDRKRRDYESLFADNVVARRQEPKTQTVATPAAPVAPAAPVRDEAPPSGLVLLEGTVIEAVLTNRLEGSRDGPVNAMVTTDVYIGHTLVIPKGSRILGTAKGVQDLDEERLAIGFHRVLTPDGRSISLDKDIPGLDQQGAQGVKDLVNRHYWSTFGAAAAVGVLSGLGQFMNGVGYNTGGGRDSTVIVTGATDDISQAMAMTLRHFLQRRPTVTIREGHRLRIFLTSDVRIPT